MWRQNVRVRPHTHTHYHVHTRAPACIIAATRTRATHALFRGHLENIIPPDLADNMASASRKLEGIATQAAAAQVAAAREAALMHGEGAASPAEMHGGRGGFGRGHARGFGRGDGGRGGFGRGHARGFGS